MLQITNVAKLILLELKMDYIRSLRLHLYQNDYVPTGASGIADFTEADFSGYAAQAVDDWTDPELNGLNQAVTTTALHTFTQTSEDVVCDVYGYYVTEADDTTVVFAERDSAAPVAFTATDKTLSILLQFIDTTYVP